MERVACHTGRDPSRSFAATQRVGKRRASHHYQYQVFWMAYALVLGSLTKSMCHAQILPPAIRPPFLNRPPTPVPVPTVSPVPTKAPTRRTILPPAIRPPIFDRTRAPVTAAPTTSTRIPTPPTILPPAIRPPFLDRTRAPTDRPSLRPSSRPTEQPSGAPSLPPAVLGGATGADNLNGSDGVDKGMLIFVIAGVCGSLLLLVGGLVAFTLMRKRQRGWLKEVEPAGTASPTSHQEEAPDFVVDVAHQDDVSTLGFITLAAGSSSDAKKKEQEAPDVTTVAAESVKQEATFVAENMAEVGRSSFDVICPPGKLGLILDSNDDGEHVVTAIRDTSPLASTVQVGDVLIALDEEPVGQTSAPALVQKICVKGRETRVLTFLRQA